MQHNHDHHPVRQLIILGLLTAIGPLAIDMYLPALPGMGAALTARPQALQATLTSFYLALGCGQLLAGPLSDAFGRRPPLLAGLLLFALAGIGCALAPNVQTLVALRLLQGLGACAAIVTPRAVLRDQFAGAAAAQRLGLLMTIYSVSPLLAPLVGSTLAHGTGWRGVFWTLAALGLLGALAAALGLPETLPAAARKPLALGAAARTYAALARDARFLRPAVMAALILTGFSLYVAGSPFVLDRCYGVPARSYALLFALNALPYVAATQCTGWLTRRCPPQRIVRAALTGQCAVAAALAAAFAAGGGSLVLMQVGLMAVFAFSGVLVPTLFVLAMQEQPQRAGSASALLGAFNFAGGALGMTVLARSPGGTPLPLLLGITACMAAAFALSRGGFGRG